MHNTSTSVVQKRGSRTPANSFEDSTLADPFSGLQNSRIFGLYVAPPFRYALRSRSYQQLFYGMEVRTRMNRMSTQAWSERTVTSLVDAGSQRTLRV